MKVTRTLRFELGQDELANIEELVIVLNPGNGIAPRYLTFDQDFNLVEKKKAKAGRIRVVRSHNQINRAKQPAQENEENQAVQENEANREKIDESFISAIISDKSKLEPFLAPVSDCEKTLLFRRSELKPYSMAIAHEPLQDGINRFTFGKNRTIFEQKIYEFFIENPLGQLFYFKQMSPWHIGLWMVMDPYGLLEVCGGAVTFRAIEFSFRDIRKQLEERVIKAHGHLPIPIKPAVKEKRKYTKRQSQS